MDQDDSVELPTNVPGSRAQFTAIIAGLIPFVFHYRSVSTVNGVVTSYIDYVAVIGGLVAGVLGALGLVGARRASDEGRTKRLALSAVALLLGLVQLVLGFGLV